MTSFIVWLALLLATDDLAKARALATPAADYDTLLRAVVMAYDVAKVTDNAAKVRGDAIAFGIATAERAIRLKEEPLEALVYESLLIRAKASMAADDAARDELTAEADAVRARAVAIAQARKKAAARASGWTTWEIWIVQDGKIVFPEEGVITLDRKPFSIFVMMPELAPVMLNASADDRVFKRIVDGFDLVKDCHGEIVAMCGGTGMAEEPFNPKKRLVLCQDCIHYLYYDGPDDHRYSRHKEQGSIHRLERDVAMLGDTPIEKTTLDTLYLLFAVRTHDDGKLHEDELRRVKVRFR